jgi:hypothetical protein
MDARWGQRVFLIVERCRLREREFIKVAGDNSQG